MNRKVAGSVAGFATCYSFMGLFSSGNHDNTNPPPPLPPAPVSPPASRNSKSGNAIRSPEELGINPSGFFKYGFPGPVNDLESKQEFVSCYDRRNKNPYWVLEHINKDSITSNRDVDRKYSVFKEDEKIPQKFRALLKDYFKSGYDRGHQAPAADAKFNQLAMNETFDLTNIAPQVGDGFNRDYWAHLEDFCRRLTKKYDSVRIITGPLYLPKKFPDGKFRVVYEVIGNPPNVAVPTHFFKLVVGEKDSDPKSVAVSAFVLPNDKISNDTPLTDFQVPVEALERSSGLTFFNKLDSSVKVKNMCHEVSCLIIVRDFSNKMKAIGDGKGQLALPAPRN